MRLFILGDEFDYPEERLEGRTPVFRLTFLLPGSAVQSRVSPRRCSKTTASLYDGIPMHAAAGFFRGGERCAMANKSEMPSGAAGREPAHADRDKPRMKAGYGRESAEHPEDTGIRRGNPTSTSGRTAVEADGGEPSRQTSTADDMSGQL